MSNILVSGPTAVSTQPNDANTYLVQPNATLTVTNGLSPESVIIDNGGTVIFDSTAKEQGNIFVLGKGILVFANLSFIAPAGGPGGEHIQLDSNSFMGIAGMPTSEAPQTFTWSSNLSGQPDPTSGSFNLSFADLPQVGLNASVIGSAKNSAPPWSFSQVGIPGAFSGIFSSNTAVPAGAVNVTPNQLSPPPMAVTTT